jgi:hypothetical protein
MSVASIAAGNGVRETGIVPAAAVTATRSNDDDWKIS